MQKTLAALAAAHAFVLCSCGFSAYPMDFAKATTELPRPASNAEGPWVGTWKSKVNGHHGPVWCIVTPTAGQPGHYDFRYRAGWGVFKFGDYTHTLPAVLKPDGSIDLSGSMVLPGGFGEYEVNGKLTRDSFTATYRSEADHGTMTLERPVPPAEKQAPRPGSPGS